MIPGGSKHIPRKFHPPQTSEISVLFVEKEQLWGSWPGLSPFSVSVFVFHQLFKHNYQPMECSLGCLEGPSIFLESFILLRDHVSVCREGEVSQSGFSVPRAQLLIPWYATLFWPLLAAPEDQSEESGQFSGVVFNSKQVFFSWVWPENACVES